MTVSVSVSTPSLYSKLRSIGAALRLHQWSKNALITLPALAGHLRWTGTRLESLAAGLLAFSLVASAVYLLNDVLDREHDSAHPTKRLRPIASGEVGVTFALCVALLLVATAGVLLRALPWEFAASVGAYFGLSVAYSAYLKRKVLVDVLTLAALYTLRVVAGGALFGIALSGWFLPFCIFLFLSLALVKRVVELRALDDEGIEAGPRGRGYLRADLPVLSAVGAAAAMASTLVYGLYISSPDVGAMYSHPLMLWAGMPILLYWPTRVWLLVMRDKMPEDPVVFALSDRTSYLAFVAFLGVLALSS